jgi:hypothetical protein
MTTRTSPPLKVKLGIGISRRDSDSNESLSSTDSTDSTELAEWDYSQRNQDRGSGGSEQDEVVRKRRENKSRRVRERDTESECIWREFWG